MIDLISREAVMRLIGKEVLIGAVDMISIPSVDAVEVVFSHWEAGGKTMKDIYCIECGYVLPKKCKEFAESGDFKHCPNCGAKMTGGIK